MGKTSCAVAIGHRILDQAEAGKVDATGFAFASKLRFVSAIDLARARSDRARSDAEPRIIREAKCASLLILDEIAYEATKFDPQVVRDVIYERYRYGAKRPMIVTSGARMAELHERYGEAMIRRITDMGSVIDLW
jgi:DNA replication protein DnaC